MEFLYFNELNLGVYAETYLEPSRTSKMELFVKIVLRQAFSGHKRASKINFFVKIGLIYRRIHNPGEDLRWNLLQKYLAA